MGEPGKPAEAPPAPDAADSTRSLTCLDDRRISDLLAGRLSQSEERAVHQHAQSCSSCSQLLARAAGTGVPRPSPPGPTQIDEYKILRRLGSGAMGEVHLAHDALLDREVAIKLLSDALPDHDCGRRLLVEARAIARVHHKNVVLVHRVGTYSGRLYLVSEYVRGKSLREIAKPLPWPEVVRIGIALAGGLAAAHAQGVLHRDVKPANVMLTAEGEVKLLDFGLAKLIDAAHEPASAETGEEGLPLGATRTGAVLGTPLYLAPELWRGEPASAASDLYALGALLYELACGHPPHKKEPMAELRRLALEQEAPPLQTLVPGLSPAEGAPIDRCLRRKPAERFSSAEAFVITLAALAWTNGSERATRPRARRRLGLGLAGLGAVVLAVL